MLCLRPCRYEETTKDVTKWQNIVKANREAPTLKFATGREEVQRTSTTAALTAKFAPARDFEREIASMLEAAGAHNEQAVQEAEEALALKVKTPDQIHHLWTSCIARTACTIKPHSAVDACLGGL